MLSAEMSELLEHQVCTVSNSPDTDRQAEGAYRILQRTCCCEFMLQFKTLGVPHSSLVSSNKSM